MKREFNRDGWFGEIDRHHKGADLEKRPLLPSYIMEEGVRREYTLPHINVEDLC
jgi:hypothetical protein